MLYPHVIHPLHTVIKINIAYSQTYIAKCKRCFAIFNKKFCLQQAKLLSMLGIFIVK